MSLGIIRNLKKSLSVQKERMEKLEVELSQVKKSKACLEDDFFHAIEQLRLTSVRRKK
jgi:hypothetical protein